MSSKIDERIVNMKFDNAQFEKGVSETSKSLENLKKGLELKDAGKGLDGLAASVKNLPLQGIADAVQTIASKFSALSIIGITALTNIANKAVDVGIQMAKSLTIDPIKAGLDEYELKMGSIQTILANTERYGTSLQDVSASLNELNDYADKTIYNFGDMTKNIGLFTNAGIRIEDATSMIQGFSNMAAASGTSAQGAASAAYQLSQALSAGTIRLMDWRSLTNVGMGNKNMQLGLIEIADAMGTLNEKGISAKEIQSDFNGSLEKNWLSADVMSNYLKIMAGDMTEAEQAALGLSDAQIKAFAASQKTAEEAATKVRTFTGLVGTMREAVGSGWSQTFEILIGDFDEATELFTAVNNEVSGIIGSMADARNDLLEAFASMGGRDMVLEAFANIWQAFKMFILPIKSAFEEIFPPTTAHQLLVLANNFRKFSESLKPSADTMKLLKRTFMGVFAALDIGWEILKQVFGLFGRLAGAVAPASTGILGMTANIGDWLVSVRDAIKSGEGLYKVFEFLGDFGEKTIQIISDMGTAVGNTLAFDSWADAWERIAAAVQKVWDWLSPFFAWVGAAFAEVSNAVGQAFQAMDFNILVGLLNTGILAGVFVVIKKFLDSIPGLFGGIGGGIFDTIKGAFGELTNTMQTMQEKLKAEVLQKIAIAIGILTAAVVALSFIDTAKLFISLGAMQVMFAQLAAMMLVMETLFSGKNLAKFPVLAASMILLSTAMVIFSSAMLIMASLEWDEIARGMVGLAGGLLVLLGAVELMGKAKGEIVKSAAGILVLSAAVVVLASALRIMGALDWDQIARGLVGLGGALIIVGVAARIAKESQQGAIAMLIMSAALTVLASALLIMGKMDWDTINRALTTLAGSVLIMAIGVRSMEGSVKGAAAMAIVASGILILSAAFSVFAKLSWDEIGRGLVALGGSLAILAGAMALMGLGPVLLGAVGLVAAAGALMLLAPALTILGLMSWDMIGRGLAMLAASLGILAVGGVLLIPAIPAFLALGAAAALIGLGAMAAGSGMVMMAAGLGALAAVAVIGSEAIKMAVLTLIGIIPEMMAAFAQGLIDFALVIAGGAIEFTAAMTTLLTALIDAIGNVGPKVINTLWNLLMLMADKLEKNVPILVTKGANLIIGILNGMASKVPKIVEAGANLIIAFIRGISEQVPRLAEEGAKAVIRLVNGIADAIDRNAAAMGRAGGRLAASIIRGMVNGISAGIGEIVRAAQNMASNALEAAKNFLGINSPSKEFMKVGSGVDEGMAKGIMDNAKMVSKAGTYVGETALEATKKSLANLKSSVMTDMDVTPSIKPVLDLSAVKKDADLIKGLITPPSLKLDSSVAYASQAQMAGYKAQAADDDLAQMRQAFTKSETLIFNQTNNSPKALTNAEIYRRTRNQISLAKKELTTPDDTQ